MYQGPPTRWKIRTLEGQLAALSKLNEAGEEVSGSLRVLNVYHLVRDLHSEQVLSKLRHVVADAENDLEYAVASVQRDKEHVLEARKALKEAKARLKEAEKAAKP